MTDMVDLRDTLVDAVRVVKIVPAGSDAALAPIPDAVDVTDADVERAVAWWDDAARRGFVESDFVGLLTSDVVREGDT